MVASGATAYLVGMGCAAQSSASELETLNETDAWVCLRPLEPDTVQGWVLPTGDKLNLAKVCALLPSAVAGGTNVRLTVVPDGLWVDDRGGRRGVYLPLLGEEELEVGDEVLVGRTLIRIVATEERRPETVVEGADALTRPDIGRKNVTALPGSNLRFRLLIQSVFNGPVSCVDVEDDEVVVGAEDGDVVIVDDPEMSPVHALLVLTPTGLRVTDLDSREGTFRRARHGEVIPLGYSMVIDHTLLTSERFDEDRMELSA